MTARRCHHGPRASGFRPVVSIRENVDEAEVPRFTRQALNEIHAYLREQSVPVDGPPFSICHRLADRRVDVEAGWPAHGASGRRRIHSGTLPESALRARAVRSRPPG